MIISSVFLQKPNTMSLAVSLDMFFGGVFFFINQSISLCVKPINQMCQINAFYFSHMTYASSWCDHYCHDTVKYNYPLHKVYVYDDILVENYDRAPVRMWWSFRGCPLGCPYHAYWIYYPLPVYLMFRLYKDMSTYIWWDMYTERQHWYISSRTVHRYMMCTECSIYIT